MRITTGWRAAPRNQPSRRRSGSRLRLGVAATAGLLGLPLITMASTPAHAADTEGWGFVLADQPTMQLNFSYIPNRVFQANSTGGINQITHTGVGRYSVYMPGLTMGNGTGNTQITAHSETGRRCRDTVTREDPRGGTEILVQCYDGLGSSSDAQFSASYHYDTTQRAGLQHAYVYADQKSNRSYTPLRAYQSNSRGGTNTITHPENEPGVYVVTLGRFTNFGGNVQVTATKGSSNHCKVRRWDTTTVTVHCYAANGLKADQEFLLSYTEKDVPTRPTRNHGAHLLAERSDEMAWYRPDASYSWNSGGMANQVRKVGPGHYQVLIEGMSPNYSNVIVTAFGSDATTCATNRWILVNTPQLGSQADVWCTNRGVATDSRFTFLLTSNYRR